MATNNNVILYQGLFLFRNAFLTFILEKLREAYGKGFWKGGIEPALGEDMLASLQKQFERRYRQSLASVKRPGDDVVQMLDIGHFLPIVQRNWNRCFVVAFQEQNKAKVEVWLGEVIEVRNAVAHMENEPLADDDTWRALDNMARILTPITPEVAEQISLLRTKGEIADTEITHNRPLLHGWKQGPHDYELGLNRLEKDILRREDKGSELHLKYLRHRDQLANVLWDKRLSPGILNSELEYRLERILEELDRLAISYSDAHSFVDLCIAPETIAETPASASALVRIHTLEQEIDELQRKLFRSEFKKTAQTQTGETVPQLERQLSEFQSRLDAKRKERNNLLETAAPVSYFSITRRLLPGNTNIFVEDQVITVGITIKNLGRQQANIVYEENLPQVFNFVDGSLRLETCVEAGAVMTISYRCFCSRIGSYNIRLVPL